MFASSILFTALASMAAAAPVARDGAPAGWAYGYLEKYDTYHTRYLALDCQDKHNTDFFDQCCHPLLADESLDTRPAQCTPSESQSSAAVAAATASVQPSDDAKAEFQAATSTVEASSAAPSPTASNDDSNNNNNNNNNNSGNSGDNTGGFATFFYQNGNAGACGNVNSDSTPLVAIDQAWWSNFGQVSPYCGQWVSITNTQNGKTVNAQVQDVCPTCANGNSLDLSTGAFNQIADESEGSVPITWHFT